MYMSFGGGVQSTALAMLALEGHPDLLRVTGGRVPEAYIFADTGEEPRAVYDHLEKIKELIPLIIISPRVRLSEPARRGKPDMPIWVESSSGRAPLRRQCTKEWKVLPVLRAAKKYFKVNLRRKPPYPLVSQWMGVSFEQAQRVRESRDVWRHNAYPLVAMGWTRADCESYLLKRGIVAPKSACVFCPLRSNEEWKYLTQAELKYAAEFEDALKLAWENKQGYLSKLKSSPSLHRSGVPIRLKPFFKEGASFNEECEGVCGV